MMYLMVLPYLSLIVLNLTEKKGTEVYIVIGGHTVYRHRSLLSTVCNIYYCFISMVFRLVCIFVGGMCSLNSAVQFPDRVGRMVSISSCGYSHPSSIAVRYLQRKSIMTDPNWHEGN